MLQGAGGKGYCWLAHILCYKEQRDRLLASSRTVLQGAEGKDYCWLDLVLCYKEQRVRIIAG